MWAKIKSTSGDKISSFKSKTAERAASLKEITLEGAMTLERQSLTLQSRAKSFAESMPLPSIPSSISLDTVSSTGSEVESDTSPTEKASTEVEKSADVPTPKHTDSDQLLVDGIGAEMELTRKQRTKAASMCYTAGAVCSFLAATMAWSPKHLADFAFFYTLGNLCSLGSSLFVIGPMRQIRVMCLPVRRGACILWMTCMVLTIVVAAGFPSVCYLVMPLVFIQYVAMLWYGASFVPFGRTVLWQMCTRTATSVSNV